MPKSCENFRLYNTGNEVVQHGNLNKVNENFPFA